MVLFLYGAYNRLDFLAILALGVGAIIVMVTVHDLIEYSVEKLKARRKINEYEPQLPALEKKEREAMNEFKAMLFIPYDYWYEYALNKMLKFVENKQASNWERVTDLYEEHLHRITVEENARITAENSKLQTEIARKNLSATRSAAAGAWASAAGIWLK